MDALKQKKSWRSTLSGYRHPRVITMLFFGFSAGLPLLLIFSSLSLWLREANVDRSTVTLFSWAALGYAFKFIWAPIIDKMPLPWLTRVLGRRRAWLFMAQLAIITAILWMAFTDPAQHLLPMAIAAVMLGFSSATQDIVIDAYRIESAGKELQALIASSYVAGYRIGMIASGAGALKLASWFGSNNVYNYDAWQNAYICMALLMGVGVVTTLVITEPQGEPDDSRYLNTLQDYLRFLALFVLGVTAFIITFSSVSTWVAEIKNTWIAEFGINQSLAGFVIEGFRLLLSIISAFLAARIAIFLKLTKKEVLSETYITPMVDFFDRYGKMALWILALIGLYRISDIVLGAISNVFYQDMGYTKDQIADITKTFGLLMTILGGFLGGGLALRYGVMKILFLGALLSALTNLFFMGLAESAQPSVTQLVMVIAADNLSGGLASAAFVAYLSSLTNLSFTAFQYALFSSLMTLFPKMLGGYSGSIADSVGYSNFFLISALIGVPVLFLVWMSRHYTDTND